MATRGDILSVDNDSRPTATSTSSMHSETSEVTLNAVDSRHDVPATDDHRRTKNCPSAGVYMSVPTEEPQKPHDNEAKKVGITYQPLRNLDILRLWKYEFLAIIVSVLAFVSMVILLKVSNGKPQPQFAYYINITTMIAVFTTLLRAVVLFIVTEVIGQYKWLWMDRPRPLRHIEHFDNAGRGIWGSLRLLFLTSKPMLIVLASLIVITSYAIGPFAQQGVKTYPCSVDGDGIASISIAERVVRSDVDIEAQGGSRAPDRAVIKSLRVRPELQMIALNGLLTDTPNGSVNLFQCDSGNCTFPPRGSGVTHTSLGLCSTCTDVRSKLLESRHISNFSGVLEADRDYRFNNQSDFGISTFFKSGIFNMTTEKTEPSSLENFENTKTSILSFTAKGCARSGDLETGSQGTKCEHNYDNMPGLFSEFDIIAANCSLHPCLRRYHANVLNGVLNEELVSTAPISAANISYFQANIADDIRKTRVFRNFSYVAMIEPCIVDDIWYDSSNVSQAPREGVDWTSWGTGDTLCDAPSNCVGYMDPTEFLGIRTFFLQTLKGSCVKRTSGSNRPSSSLEDGRISCQGGFWVDALFNSGNATFDDISTAFDNMATALTDRMRTKGHEFLTESRSFINGTSIQMAICMRVDWPWLLYPGILLVLTTVLFVTTCCQDRGRHPIWKSSILPLLFYGAETRLHHLDTQRDSSDASQTVPLLQLTELESIADKTKARFCSGRDEAGFIVEVVKS